MSNFDSDILISDTQHLRFVDVRRRFGAKFARVQLEQSELVTALAATQRYGHSNLILSQ